MRIRLIIAAAFLPLERALGTKTICVAPTVTLTGSAGTVRLGSVEERRV